MIKRIFVVVAVGAMLVISASAQVVSWESAVDKVLAGKKAKVGAAVYGVSGKESMSVNGDERFPMQSVFKFPIALAVLHQVDQGKLKLEQKIYIKKTDLLPDTWSPIREKYPNGDVELSLAEILKYTVAESDNNGCDLLLRLIGGPKVVESYMHELGIKEMSIQANEEEAHKAWDVQYRNWTTPKAAAQLLVLFDERKILAEDTYNFLWKVMLETKTGKNRIKGGVPEGTPVAHKTGSSDTNKEGLTAATNDIGIVTLSNGKRFVICVFVSDSKENSETNEKIIADISKLSWDYFSNTKNQ